LEKVLQEKNGLIQALKDARLHKTTLTGPVKVDDTTIHIVARLSDLKKEGITYAILRKKIARKRGVSIEKRLTEMFSEYFNEADITIMIRTPSILKVFDSKLYNAVRQALYQAS
jgi:hypothetical protein